MGKQSKEPKPANLKDLNANLVTLRRRRGTASYERHMAEKRQEIETYQELNHLIEGLNSDIEVVETEIAKLEKEAK